MAVDWFVYTDDAGIRIADCDFGSDGNPDGDENSAFIVAAREGWPHALNRAIAAEAELENLKGYIAMSEVNCTAAYNDLQQDRDVTKAKLFLAEEKLEKAEVEVERLREALKNLLDHSDLEIYSQKDIDQYKDLKCLECGGDCRRDNNICDAPEVLTKFNNALVTARSILGVNANASG